MRREEEKRKSGWLDGFAGWVDEMGRGRRRDDGKRQED